MSEFYVKESFQFGAGIRRAGTTIEVSDIYVEAEKAKGRHKNGKWLSPLLNHCLPDDDATAVLLGEEKKPEDVAEDEAVERISQIKKELESMGATFDNRWNLKRFEAELVKAKKIRGI